MGNVMEGKCGHSMKKLMNTVGIGCDKGEDDLKEVCGKRSFSKVVSWAYPGKL